MDLLVFFIALALLLVVPGPTNTVLAIVGAERGFRRGLPLALTVLAGYLAVILPVVLVAAPFLEARPLVADAVKLIAAAWVLLLALRLWSLKLGVPSSGSLSATSVLATTLLNPKGLVIGLALLPPVSVQLGLAAPLGVLAVTVLTVSAIWIGFGATAIAALGQRHPRLVARAASASLIVFGAGLAARAMGMM